MVIKEVRFSGEYGLHMRIAALLAKKCSDFCSEILIRNMDKNSEFQDAKSVLGLLGLRIEKGTLMEIRVIGLDERVAIEVVCDWMKKQNK